LNRDLGGLVLTRGKAEDTTEKNSWTVSRKIRHSRVHCYLGPIGTQVGSWSVFNMGLVRGLLSTTFINCRGYSGQRR